MTDRWENRANELLPWAAARAICAIVETHGPAASRASLVAALDAYVAALIELHPPVPDRDLPTQGCRYD